MSWNREITKNADMAAAFIGEVAKLSARAHYMGFYKAGEKLLEAVVTATSEMADVIVEQQKSIVAQDHKEAEGLDALITNEIKSLEALILRDEHSVSCAAMVNFLRRLHAALRAVPDSQPVKPTYRPLSDEAKARLDEEAKKVREELRPLTDSLRASHRLTGDDYNIRITSPETSTHVPDSQNRGLTEDDERAIRLAREGRYLYVDQLTPKPDSQNETAYREVYDNQHMLAAGQNETEGAAVEDGELKPCPFCGNPGPCPRGFEQMDDAQVWCASCHSGSGLFQTLAQAIAAWNRRSPLPVRDPKGPLPYVSIGQEATGTRFVRDEVATGWRPDWICEFCYKPVDGNLPPSWELAFQSAVCPECRTRVASDGGYHIVKGGAYAYAKDPRPFGPRAPTPDSAPPGATPRAETEKETT